MKLAAVTVAYNPDAGTLRENLQSYAHDVDMMVLWDNSTEAVKIVLFEDRKVAKVRAIATGYWRGLHNDHRPYHEK